MEEKFRYGKCIFINPSIKYIDEMHEMLYDKEIISNFSTEKNNITREMEINWINEHQNDNIFFVIDAYTLEYIGNCSFNEIEDNRGEIGVIIRKTMRGKHYAKDIIRGLIEYGFNVLGLDEIYSVVFSDNIKSVNCMIQLGFKEYNRDKNVAERNGNQVDDIYFNIKK